MYGALYLRKRAATSTIKFLVIMCFLNSYIKYYSTSFFFFFVIICLPRKNLILRSQRFIWLLCKKALGSLFSIMGYSYLDFVRELDFIVMNSDCGVYNFQLVNVHPSFYRRIQVLKLHQLSI